MAVSSHILLYYASETQFYIEHNIYANIDRKTLLKQNLTSYLILSSLHVKSCSQLTSASSILWRHVLLFMEASLKVRYLPAF